MIFLYNNISDFFICRFCTCLDLHYIPLTVFLSGKYSEIILMIYKYYKIKSSSILLLIWTHIQSYYILSHKYNFNISIKILSNI